MKSASVFVLVFFFSETIAINIHKERQSKGLYPNSKVNDNRNIFSPRMDYDEWKPLGRGDPLKNDPTYDYVPPVLETVHYWMDPSKRTPDPPIPNPGVLILGSTRTEPTITSRFTTSKYQTKEPQPDSRIDTMSLLDPFLKLMDVSSQFSLDLGSSTAGYPRPPPNRIHQSYQRPIHSKPKIPPQALQRPPYTMLMPPPPPPQTAPPFATSTITTTESTTIRYPTVSPVFTSSVEPPTTTTSKSENESNITTIYPTVIVNTENVYKPVAISMPDQNVNETRNEMEHPEKEDEDSSMVLPIVSMFKNHKKEIFQEHEHDVDEFKENQNPKKHTHEDHLHHHHYSPSGNSVTFPEEQKNYFEGNSVKTPSEVMIPPLPPQKQSFWKQKETYRQTLTTTKKPETLTTDPMFKHYKQPQEPVKGPFYLIIQGHSKVKTYGASKNPINGLLTSNEIKDDDDEERKPDYYSYESQESIEKPNRRSKKLKYSNGRTQDMVEGNPTFEVSISYKTEEETKNLSPEETIDHLDTLEETFGKSNGGSSKKRYLNNDLINITDHRKKRSAYDGVVNKNRRLLQITESSNFQELPTVEELSTKGVDNHESSTKGVEAEPSSTTEKQGKKKKKKKPVKDEDNFDLESFIAVNDDYTAEDVVSLILKDEGQGSGFGNFVSSIFGRSMKQGEEM